jgi:uncharacterized membrane protein HdeD (DUF308 family)
MLELIVNHWWTYVIRGLLAIAFGMMALIVPGITLQILILIFGVYVIVEGLLAILAAFSNRKENAWWLLLLEGIMGIAIGVFAFIWPGITAIVLLIFIAVWAIMTGIFEIAAAIQLRKAIKGEWVLGIAGVLSILIGFLLIINPGPGALAIVWLIGIYALIFGLLLMYLGFKGRRLKFYINV